VAAPGAAKRIYLHARAEYAELRDEVRKELMQEGMAPLVPAASSGASLADWTRESKTRIETAKRCQALALVRADADESFIGDLLDIGVDERERIQTARGGTPLPCAVLDHSGESLPIDVSAYDIQRFDLAEPSWRGEFRSWLDHAQAAATSAGPAL
jgi:hypothetical protein